MNKNENIIIVGSKPWNKNGLKRIRHLFTKRCFFINKKDELSISKLNSLFIKYIFFLHWSWKVPDEIIKNYECICFHMTDLPYGRGGSPLQNLIILGHQKTQLTALRMISEFDAGPVYLKEDLFLGGTAEEIYIRATQLAYQMIEKIIKEQPKPIPQSGEVVTFKRRKPDESKIPQLNSLLSLHDFIRMLDAEGYPKAFLEHQGFRYEFSRSALYNGKIVADVTITPIDEETK
ncbi:methionyl-tRNA formyltransferase (plasmid) [[Synechococcus] sp. NIES-970]|nr:methionyl-tRNA formyltransferase [[Synechococcus] sp. NIES-970]